MAGQHKHPLQLVSRWKCSPINPQRKGPSASTQLNSGFADIWCCSKIFRVIKWLKTSDIGKNSAASQSAPGTPTHKLQLTTAKFHTELGLGVSYVELKAKVGRCMRSYLAVIKRKYLRGWCGPPPLFTAGHLSQGGREAALLAGNQKSKSAAVGRWLGCNSERYE